MLKFAGRFCVGRAFVRVRVTERHFSDEESASANAGEELVKRFEGLSSEDVDRTETAVSVRAEELSGLSEPYTSVIHTLELDGQTWYSVLMFRDSVRNDVVEDYSMWPGESAMEVDADAKIEAVGHNVANAAIDAYVASSNLTEFDVSPPEVSRRGADASPFDGGIPYDEGADYLANNVVVGDEQFVHLLVGPTGAFSAPASHD